MAGCNGCGSTQIVDDAVTGDVVCTACGWVVDDERVYCAGPRPSSRRCAGRSRPKGRGAVRADSLLARAARAVAADFDIDPTLLLLESARAGVPGSTRGAVDVALCRAVARLCGSDV
ncbi:TF Zn Ribbon incomplete domain containing protein [Pandoravirus japonicus]|uniref:TF Zn Ribbon incomplete domain containing protein n=1 Tax=Pandoravirus japonicus TaxID=2823154 RepID=A0A811BQ87_9VIRU|nr:TF Zn Ribbon incomplete domain containing protein [Pandoravirus japonicus]